ncbi:IMP dehydrogenase [Streptomyces sp. NPDC059168]|uniref:IMP dehydrogenase n=1 Tax=Streptomyces sp. NPDC059168 TaxID=3346753 RepID=UPI0036BD19EA
MATALDTVGGLTFLHHNQATDDQAEQVRQVKKSSSKALVGAGVNTHDYQQRIPALVTAGVDVLCVDSSDGHSAWQADVLAYAREHFPELPVGGGNVVDRAGFDFLAAAGASFVKVGIGGGSVSTARDHKGIGRGQASALREVAEARDALHRQTGEYVPLVCDGGILLDCHMVLALAMGADALMMGRYFARFDQSPGRMVRVGQGYFKEYWGEGSPRGQRHHGSQIVHEEGAEGYVPYAGDLEVGVSGTLAKIRAAMVGCGAQDLPALRAGARIVRISQQSFLENTHHLRLRENDEVRLA